MSAATDYDQWPEATFEGPEKTLVVDFDLAPLECNNQDATDHAVAGSRGGLREVSRGEWEEVLAAAKCAILSMSSNDHFDSYVLSESSLFVYPRTAVLKTCGETLVINAIPPLLECAVAKRSMSVARVTFTRKNYSFPEKQLAPHTSFEEERRTLDAMLGPVFGRGGAFVLGPLSGDHLCVYSAHHDAVGADAQSAIERRAQHVDGGSATTINMMMHDLDPTVTKAFYMAEGRGEGPAPEISTTVGIDKLIPGAVVQDWLFAPCGYSTNALKEETYFTIHVTPEADCSYASFETNAKQEMHGKLIRAVLQMFRPKRTTLGRFLDAGGASFSDVLAERLLTTESGLEFVRSAYSTADLGLNRCCTLVNYTRKEA